MFCLLFKVYYFWCSSFHAKGREEKTQGRKRGFVSKTLILLFFWSIFYSLFSNF